MKLRVLWLTLLPCISAVGWTQSSEDVTELVDFLVEPIRTDAQRVFISKEASVYACVNCNALIGADVFQVDSYPTTIWINCAGIVEDYEVGFESPEELEARIVKLLQGE